MKFSTVATLVAATAGVVAAQPRHHHHRHQHKRSPVADAPPAISTVVIYEVNGQEIPADVALAGLADGQFVWAKSGSTSQDGSLVENLKPAGNLGLSIDANLPANNQKKASIASTQTNSSGFGAGPASNVDVPFPDGEIDCDQFPSAYGALAVDYLGLGGYTGIQIPGSNNGGFSDILTVISSSCNGGSCCSEGAYCSYACAEGYLKSQWPATQGATGQSVGGLLCQNGKLHLTNPSLSNNLCIPGASQVKVLVQNNLPEQVAICATDYPGLESETIPLAVMPNQVNELACPDAATYYHWQGASTSRQYYVNPMGYSVEQACQWGSAGLDIGNFSPMNIGAGVSDGVAYLSLIPNTPTTNALLSYSIEIIGDNLSGSCKYSNGQYCSATGCTSNGCTVSAASGTVTYVLSP